MGGVHGLWHVGVWVVSMSLGPGVKGGGGSQTMNRRNTVGFLNFSL